MFCKSPRKASRVLYLFYEPSALTQVKQKFHVTARGPGKAPLRNKSEPGSPALKAGNIAYWITTIVLAFCILSCGAAETVHYHADCCR